MINTLDYRRAMTAMCLVLFTTAASAHGLWITVNTPHGTHGAKHALAFLGFGHSYPADELLSLPGNLLQLSRYDILDPEGEYQSLGIPDLTYKPPATTVGGLLIERGDLGVRKLTQGPDAKEGTYQVVAASKPFVVTRYRDGDGAVKTAPLGIDKIEDAEAILFSVEFQSAAKAYFHHEKSTVPDAAGLDLEIMPVGDFSNVRAGDAIELQVLFHGRPLTTDADFEYVVQASSNASTLWDGVTLRAAIYGGKARLRLPTPGQWHLFADLRELVSGNPDLARHDGKVLAVYHSTSLSIDVKP